MTEMAQMLADSATALFAAEVTPELLAAVDAGAWPAELWAVLARAEYPRLFAEGGDEVGWVDAHPLVLAAGEALAPIPLPETLLASWLLVQAGLAVPEGIGTVVPERATEYWEAREREGRWSVTGRAVGVPWGSRSAYVVVVAAGDDGPVLAALPTARLGITPDRNAAGEPRDTLDTTASDGVEPLCAAPLPSHLPPDIVQRFGALLRATQIAGATKRILRLTAAYAKDRQQFGRALRDFQAISQQLAVLAEAAAAAEVAAAIGWRAAAADPASRAVAVAKIRCGATAGVAPAIAHAVFGAIGVTAEHSLHFATRRLWSWRAEFGGDAVWAQALGAAVLRDGSERLWPSVTALLREDGAREP